MSADAVKTAEISEFSEKIGKNNNTETPKEINFTEEAKDSVVIAIGSEPETLDPTQGWGHGNSPIVQSTLVRYTADLTFENDLATDYSLSPDGLTWTFTIRDDAFFTDGSGIGCCIYAGNGKSCAGFG